MGFKEGENTIILDNYTFKENEYVNIFLKGGKEKQTRKHPHSWAQFPLHYIIKTAVFIAT